MSHIVSGGMTFAYVVSTDLLRELGALATAGRGEPFWTRLHFGGAMLKSDHLHSTSIFAGLVAFLDHSGIKISLNSDRADAQAISDLRAGLMVCASSKDAMRVLDELSQHQFETEKMRWFYEEYMRASYPDSGFAMQDALGFLTTGLMQVQHSDSWILMFVS